MNFLLLFRNLSFPSLCFALNPNNPTWWYCRHCIASKVTWFRLKCLTSNWCKWVWQGGIMLALDYNGKWKESKITKWLNKIGPRTQICLLNQVPRLLAESIFVCGTLHPTRDTADLSCQDPFYLGLFVQMCYIVLGLSLVKLFKSRWVPRLLAESIMWAFAPNTGQCSSFLIRSIVLGSICVNPSLNFGSFSCESVFQL